MSRRGLVLGVMLLAGIALAQSTTAPLGARLKLKWQGDTVRFTESGQGHEVSIHEVSMKDQFAAVRLDTVVLQSAKEANGSIYLLLDVTGPSKLPRDSHQCGGGNESNLIWLKLDKDWKTQDAKSFLYDSCWTDGAAVIDPPRWKGDTLQASTLDKVVTYTYKHPEAGSK
ncbi:MAG TPA: hypothetical protein VKW06_15855 [Candidatus Angelobacter sp.]|nr:hypothetical protein [Candidatus Angelobacter sp.]